MLTHISRSGPSTSSFYNLASKSGTAPISLVSPFAADHYTALFSSSLGIYNDRRGGVLGRLFRHFAATTCQRALPGDYDFARAPGLQLGRSRHPGHHDGPTGTPAGPFAGSGTAEGEGALWWYCKYPAAEGCAHHEFGVLLYGSTTTTTKNAIVARLGGLSMLDRR